jgi:transcription termination factor Rho
MAFRASRKSASSKLSAKDAAPVAAADVDIDIPVKPFSVDDLVGAPVVSPDEGKKSEPLHDVKDASVVAPVDQQVPAAPNVYTRPPASGSPDAGSYRGETGQGGQRNDRPYVQRSGYGSNRGYQSGGRQSAQGGRQNFHRGGAPFSGGNRFNPRPFGDNTGAMSAGSSRGGYGEAGRQGYRREWGNNNASAPSHEQDVNVPTETVHGILDVMPEGHGFLRPKFTPSDRDVYISQSQIRRFMLRNGDMVEGQARQPKENERYWGLLKVEKVDDKPAEEMNTRPRFEDLTPIYPNKILKLETGQFPLSTRIIDLVAPIGFGQRGLVVSPPKAGKTTILKEMAAGIAANYPNVHLMAALIGERPEEVTDLTRSIKGEVLASNFDESPAEQTRIAEVALDRAKRLVEMGKDVVVLLDSITRLARAYNMVVNPSGRTLSGGFDPAALYPAKKFLGAARCVEKVLNEKTQEANVIGEETGGSLTVIGTALVDTGSRMDDMIYEEFKGTGNMELHLSRALQERRVFPAIDVGKSGTRHDELLLGEEAMKKVITLRHMLTLLGDEERTMMLVERLGKTKSNAEFLESLAKGD